MDDNFADYRTFCANRLRRLERYKKAKSFCSTEEDSRGYGVPSGSSSIQNIASQLCEQRAASIATCRLTACSESDSEGIIRNIQSDNSTSTNSETSENLNAQNKFDLLKEEMISLMENDVRLLQQLLALGDSIQELKSKKQTSSQLSLNSLDEENEDPCPMRNKSPFSSSLSAVTRLYVDDEPKQNSSIQYFSRKNSVLRIPIPPRSSNRMSVNKRIPRRLSELARPPRCLSIEEPNHSDALPSEPNSAMQSQAVYGTPSARMSTASIDSGIRDASSSSPSSGSPSPTFKD